MWTWRSSTELGFSTEFMVGERNLDGTLRQHAWVLFGKDEEDKMLIETVSKDKERMFYKLETVKQIYIPWASVNSDFKCRIYGGYCSAIKRSNNWMF